MPRSGPVRAKSKIKRSSVAQLEGLARLLRAGQHQTVKRRCQKLLTLQPRDDRLWVMAALAAADGGDVGAAEACFARALALEATQHGHWMHYAQVLQKSGQRGPAIAAMGEAVRLAPTEEGYARQLAELFYRDDQFGAAAQAFDLAGKLNPGDVAAHAGQGRALYQLGHYNEALCAIDKALALSPRVADLHDVRSQCLRVLRCTTQAIAALRQALACDPGYCRGYMHFAHGFGLTDAPEMLRVIKALLEGKPSQSDECFLRFALAQERHAAGDFAAAYQHLSRANALRKREIGYCSATDKALFAAIRKGFAADVPDPVYPPASEITPIFIVGLPRSGTTLVETILSCHSKVFAGGEMNHLAKAIEATGGVQAPMNEARAKALREIYLSRLPNPGGSAFVTDKMPLNFRLIGYLAEAMPQARIVHVCRNPRATAVSLFRNFLSGEANGFACSPDDILQYFKQYSQLMAFWKGRYPDRIIQLDYEALVSAPETQSRKLLKEVGLNWEDECLAPERSQYRPRTASADQVARPIYQRGLADWKCYSPFAGDWLALFDEAETGHFPDDPCPRSERP